MIREKKCKICGKSFVLRFCSERQRTCSRTCGAFIQKQSCAKWWEKNKKAFSEMLKEKRKQNLSTIKHLQ